MMRFGLRREKALCCNPGISLMESLKPTTSWDREVQFSKILVYEVGLTVS